MFGDQAVSLTVEIVPVEIPLLISKSSMAKAKTIISVHENKATIFGRDVSLLPSSTGHLQINLRPDLIESFAFVSGTQVNESSAVNYYKLQVQFGHCTANRLVSLLKSCRHWTKKSKDVIHEVIDNCEVCRVYGQPSFKPAIGLPHSYRVNEWICIK